MESSNHREDRALWSEKAGTWDLHVGDEGDRNRRFHVHPVVWRMLGTVEGLSVLDAGCGTGYLSAKLAARGARVTAVDFAPGMVERAAARLRRLRLDVEPRVDDCCRLATVPDRSQDRLVSVYVLQDLEDLSSALAAFHRVLRPGGLAVLVFSHPCFAVPGGPQREGDTAVYTWPFAYFEERRCEEVWAGTHHATGAPIQFPSRFTFYHRPLRSYWRAVAEAGFTVLDLDEPVMQPPYDPALSPEDVRRSTRWAWSLALKVRAREATAGGA